MTTIAKTIIEVNDPRTGKRYVSQATGFKEHDDRILSEMNDLMEYDYQMSLPPEKRAIANQPTDFKCPYCKTKKEPLVRKQKMTAGFLFVHSWMIDVYICADCSREFTSNELTKEKHMVIDNNFIALQVERVKSGEIDEKQYNGIVKNYATI